MEKYIIHGGRKLSGEVSISGAKNAALPIIAATVLSSGVCVLDNLPQISDVTICFKILEALGANIKVLNKNKVSIDSSTINSCSVPYELAEKMRASTYFLGALIGRFHEAHVPFPGGCDLGDRPIDQHLKAFEALGAEHSVDGGIIDVYAKRLIGNVIYFNVNSVGATINAMLAAALTETDTLTVIENAAKEPHVVDTANFLNAMGARIVGAGTDKIKIRGVSSLKSYVEYTIIPDQIEAGTFMAAAAATGSDITISNVIPKHLESITAVMCKIGVTVEEIYNESRSYDSIRVCASKGLKKAEVTTMPHPGFPTDMQPQVTAALTLAEGTSFVSDEIFQHRFAYVSELRRMGAKITVKNNTAIVEGVPILKGSPVTATDLRAGAALVIAGLAAQGTTEIGRIDFIERGYENLIEKLRGLNADIGRIYIEESETVVKKNA